MARVDAVDSRSLPAGIAEGISQPISPPRRRRHHSGRYLLAAVGVGGALGLGGLLAARAVTVPLFEQSRAVSAASEQTPPLDTPGISDDPPKNPNTNLGLPPLPPDTSSDVHKNIEPNPPEIGVIPKEYRHLLKPNYIVDSNGQRKLTGVVGKIPGEVSIFAEQAGEFSTRILPNGWSDGTITDPNDPTMLTQATSGRIKFDNILTRPVKAGEKLGKTVDVPDDTNDINFSSTYSQYDPNTQKFLDVEKILDKHFPDVLPKPPRLVVVDKPPGDKTLYNPTYRDRTP